MAEASEGGPKPSDFFVGVVDLFAILLPGAVLTFLMREFLEHSAPALVEHLPKEGISGWATFAIVSYILGHFVFAVGSLLLDDLYDCSYREWFGDRNMLLNKKAKSDLPRCGLDAGSIDNALNWATASIRLLSPAASVEVDRLEADSKFFRSLTTLQLLGWPAVVFLIWRAVPHWVWIGYPLLPFLMLLTVVIFRSRNASLAKKDAQLAEICRGLAKNNLSIVENIAAKAENTAAIEKNKATKAKWGRGLQIVFLALIVLSQGMFIIAAMPTPFSGSGLIIAGASCLVFLLSVWRFMERRLKRTETTYEFLIMLAAKLPKSEAEEAAPELAAQRGTKVTKHKA